MKKNTNPTNREPLRLQRVRAALHAIFAASQTKRLNLSEVERLHKVGHLGLDLIQLGRLTRTGSRKFPEWLWVGAAPDQALLADVLRLREERVERAHQRKNERRRCQPTTARERFLVRTGLDQPPTSAPDKRPPTAEDIEKANRDLERLCARIDAEHEGKKSNEPTRYRPEQDGPRTYSRQQAEHLAAMAGVTLADLDLYCSQARYLAAATALRLDRRRQEELLLRFERLEAQQDRLHHTLNRLFDLVGPQVVPPTPTTPELPWPLNTDPTAEEGAST